MFELADLLGFRAGLSLLPLIDRLLDNPEMTDEVRNWGSQSRLFEHRHDVFDTESLVCHDTLLPRSREMMPETLPSDGTKKAGPTTPRPLQPTKNVLLTPRSSTMPPKPT